MSSLRKRGKPAALKHVPALGEGDFSVESGQRSVKLGDSDRDVNLKEIFGEALSESVVRLGADAGTLAGSYVNNGFTTELNWG